MDRNPWTETEEKSLQLTRDEFGKAFYVSSTYDRTNWSTASMLIFIDKEPSSFRFQWEDTEDGLLHQWTVDNGEWVDANQNGRIWATEALSSKDFQPYGSEHTVSARSSYDGKNWNEPTEFHFRLVKLPAVNTSDWNWALRAGYIQSIQYVNFLGDGDLNSWLGLGGKFSVLLNNHKNHFGFVLDSNLQYMKYGNGNYAELALMGKLRYTFREEDKKTRPFIELGGGENFVFRDNGHKGFYPMVSADLGVDIKAKENLCFTVLGEYSASFQRDKGYSPDDILDSVNSHFSLSVGLTYSFHKTEAKQ